MNKTILAIALLLPVGLLSSRQQETRPDPYEKVLENEYIRVSRMDFDTTQPAVPAEARPELGFAKIGTVLIVLEQYTKAEWAELGANQVTYKFVDASYADEGHKLSYGLHEFPGPVFRVIKVELKAPPPTGPFEQDAVKLDPTHNEVLFENGRARVVRIHFPPGESGPIVDKRPRVIILLTDTHAEVQLPNGTLSPRDSRSGTIQWSLGGSQATINGKIWPLENVVVEIKRAEPKGK
jgi:hypothetical protein